MIFLPGHKVYLPITEEWAIVQEVDDDGFIQVQTHEATSFWVHQQDVLTEEERLFELMERPLLHSFIEDTEIDLERKVPERFQPPGGHLYLLLVSDLDTPIAYEYQIWVVNGTPFDIEYKGAMSSLDGDLYQEQNILIAESEVMFCELYKEDLSMQTKLTLDLVADTPIGKVSQTLKYKFQPKKLLQLTPENQLGKRCQWILLMDREEFQSIESHLNLPMVKPKLKDRSTASKINIHDLEKKAAFPIEIDLHADKIIPSTIKIFPHEILNYQIKAFQKYMDQAIRLGVDRVFIIHGIGEGKLKNRIHQMLDQMTHIQSFKNEYHPKYGWGATEVIL